MDETNPTSDPDQIQKDGEPEAETPDASREEESSGARPTDEAPQVTPFDLTGSSGLGEGEADALGNLHKDCAGDISRRISTAVDREVGVELTAITELPYGQFQDELPEGSYVSTTTLRPLGEDIGICMDSRLAMPLIDLLLGGAGSTGEAREITAIESEILEDVVVSVARAIQTAWRPVLDQAFVFGRQLAQDEIGSLMASGEPALLLRFDVKLPESGGTLSVVMNPVTSGALLRKLLASASGATGPDQARVSERLGHHIMNTPFRVDAVLAAAPVPARELIGLKVGDILRLPHALDEPAMIVVGGQPMLSGVPVQTDSLRAVEVLARLDTSEPAETKESA